MDTLSLLSVYVFLRGSMLRTAVIVAAVLVALMPQHVLHSQETRFYGVTAFFGFASEVYVVTGPLPNECMREAQ